MCLRWHTSIHQKLKTEKRHINNIKFQTVNRKLSESKFCQNHQIMANTIIKRSITHEHFTDRDSLNCIVAVFIGLCCCCSQNFRIFRSEFNVTIFLIFLSSLLLSFILLAHNHHHHHTAVRIKNPVLQCNTESSNVCHMSSLRSVLGDIWPAVSHQPKYMARRRTVEKRLDGE